MGDPLGIYEENPVPEQRCPRCGHLLTAASSALPGQTPPKAGDLTVCIGCASVLVFRDDLTLRLVTSAEALELDGETCIRLVKLIRAIQTVHRDRARKRHQVN